MGDTTGSATGTTGSALGTQPAPAGGAPGAADATGGAQTPPAPAAGAPAAPGTPAPFALKLPEGVKLEDLGDLKSVGLEGEASQKVVDHFLKLDGARQAKAAEAAKAQDKAWADALKADKEFGGAQLDASMGIVRKALVKFGTPELQKAVDELGIGNHPELARLLYRVGKALGEDKLDGADGGPGAKPNDKQARLKGMFPGMFAAKE